MEHLRRVAAALKARDDEEEEVKDYKEGVAFHLPPQPQFFRDSVTFCFPSYFAVLIPSSFTCLLRFFEIIS